MSSPSPFNSAVSRGELILTCFEADPETREEMAPFFGFLPGNFPKIEGDDEEGGEPESEERDSVDDGHEGLGEPKADEITQPDLLPKARFLLPVYAVRHEQSTFQPKTPKKKITDAQLAVPWEHRGPSQIPLAPWSRLVHFVRSALGSQREGSRIDVRALSRSIARGELLDTLPRQARGVWALEAVLLIDRSREMQPFFADLAALEESITRERGSAGLEIRRFLEIPSIEDLENLPPGAPVLLASGMGQLWAPEMQRKDWERWQALGEELTRRGHRLSALVPCPRQRWEPTLAATWCCAMWDQTTRFPKVDRRGNGGFSALPAPAKPSSALEPLLRVLSPAVVIEPGLLRRARLLLGAEHFFDVSDEHAVWFHGELWGSAAGICGFRGSNAVARLEQLREEGRSGDTQLQAISKEVGEWVAKYHQKCSEVVQSEALGRLGWSLDIEAFRNNLTDTFAQCQARMGDVARAPGGLEGEETGLPSYFVKMVHRLPPELRGDEHVSANLALAYHYEGCEMDNIVWPKGTNVSVAMAVLQALGSQPKTLTLHGLRWFEGALWIDTDHPDFPVFTEQDPRMEMGGMLAGHPEIRIESSSHENSERSGKIVKLGKAFALPRGTASATVSSDIQGLHFESIEFPSWAEEMARDEFGLYADLEIKGVTLRMRWISPGRFTMGDEEYGPAHEVTITMGYWMAETLTTQELWTAVKDENPSKFQKSPKHPVEMVSWEDCIDFCQELESLVPELSFTLPTEAQWEYACRAGTTTKFNNGSDDDDTLKELAWFDEDLSDGSTHEVAQLAANKSGLYDMHGNVWEWCLDGRREYTSDAVTHLVGSLEEGAKRALRGGGWADDAQYCRSAYRGENAPGLRYVGIGFRLVAGQPQQVIRGAVWPEAQAQAALGQGGGAAGRGGVSKPKWADRVAEDAYGIRAEFELKDVDFVFRKISAGTFLMGSPEDENGRFKSEGPQHEVRLSRGFWAAATPVTQAQWEAVMGEGSNPSSFKGEDHPVDAVSWEDCQEYLTTLREKVPGLPVELPTEAQWEYACRAGTKTAFSDGSDCTEPSGKDPALEKLGWYEGNSGLKTNPVGKLEANAWGLLDMHGNVREWCKDGVRNYSSAASSARGEVLVDPLGTLEGRAFRALRGGGWASLAQRCRSASRDGSAPGYRYDHIGFRLVAGQEPEEEQEQGAEPKNKKQGLENQVRAERVAVPVGLWQKNVSVPWPWDKKPRLQGPSWATKVTEDDYGILAELKLDGVSFAFRQIKPGTFLMGSPEDEKGRWDDEGPQHKVTLSRGFWIGATPVTQEQWLTVLPGENPSKFQDSVSHPVEQVSWEDCQRYLQAMNERVPDLYADLPLEAQWEYACRARTKTAFSDESDCTEPTGKDPALDKLGWYDKNSEKKTHAVGLLAANPSGLYDMHGNVLEWCKDGLREFSSEPRVDPLGPLEARAKRALRGGSWAYLAQYCRSASRFEYAPGNRRDRIGFRLVAGQPSQEQENQ